MNSLLSKSAQKQIVETGKFEVATVDQVSAAAATQRRIDEQKLRDAEILAEMFAGFASKKPASQPANKSVGPLVGLTDEEIERLQR